LKKETISVKPDHSQDNRRVFMQNTSVTTAAVAAGTLAASGVHGDAPQDRTARSANEQLVLGVIGCGGQGSGLIQGFKDHAAIAATCDPDSERAERARQACNAAKAESDLRRLLDDPQIDAVVIATPDHWHAPAAILACQAGKHVYVEKPCSHNFREGQLLVQTARQTNRIVQHGTQSRSNRLIADAVQMLREGIIGDVLVAKAWNIQRRDNIGHQTPASPPAHVDYDLWIGPAEMMPYQENRFHYHWRWWHNFGTGDIGNDGTHEIDYARWGLGAEGLPTRATALGGKYFHDDDQQFPDTATCVFEYPAQQGKPKQLIFEMRLWSTNYPYQVDSGTEFYGTKGRMFLSKRGKLEVFADRNERIEKPKPKTPASLKHDDHRLDFLDAIRTNRRPNADIQVGFDSVALVHLANAAIRAGTSITIDPNTAQLINGSPQVEQLLGRTYRQHWAQPKI
jgi:predicted dehydrogenase